MTTTTDLTNVPDPTPSVGTNLPPIRPIPFLRTVHVELRKMVDTLAGRWLIILTLLSAVALQGLILWIGRDEPQTALGLFQIAGVPFNILLPVIGIMAATAEWSQRAGLVTFTLEPRRWRIIAARVVAAVVMGAIVLAATLGSAYLLGGLADLVGLDIGYELPVRQVLLLMTVLILAVLQGVAFGFLILNTPAAIVAILSLPVIWQIASGISERVADVAPWLDLGRATEPMVQGAPLTGENWAQLASAIAIGVLLPLAIGSWRVIRGEVK